MPVGRVQHRAAFAVLRQHGRRARSGALRVTFVPATTAAEAPGTRQMPRVAFAIGRDVGTAVVRNRLRRRLRAAVAELDPVPGLYLVAASSTAVTCDYAQLRGDLATVLASLGALQETAA